MKLDGKFYSGTEQQLLSENHEGRAVQGCRMNKIVLDKHTALAMTKIVGIRLSELPTKYKWSKQRYKNDLAQT
jgi:hypothetical protein